MGTSPTTGSRALASTIFASTIGTVVEWYDFILYATAAALIFNHLFFPQFDPTTGIIASFATYTVGFLVRPLGGIVFGWMGDRIGRKPVLMLTLLMMGVSTTLIGLLPTYASIGIWAPIFLLLLRIVQGLGAGAEYAGAVVMAGEIASDRRGLFASLPAAAVDVATILAAGVFALFTLLPEDAFMSWGWRIPFLLSGLVLFLGVYIRRKVPESPEFIQVKEERRDTKLPVLEVLRNHPRTMLAAMGANLAPNLSYVFQTFTLAYATSKLGFPREIILTGVMLSSAFGAVMCVVFGALSDRFGRVVIMALGSAAAAVYSLVYFQLLGAGTPWMAVVLIIIGHAIGARSSFGVQPAFYCDIFPTEVRYSAIAFAREVTGAIFVGPLPLLATALVGWYDSVWPVAMITALYCLITLASVLWVEKARRRDEQSNRKRILSEQEARTAHG
ncbi:MHS family MFS transporter [Phyllobacterium sp. 21LDTY02-6]|uniref:MFS transporter n=1 Tax=unclassified Phyllobacterium TaxID=2638441 RepID=UPI00202060FC|nr:MULTISPECIES: MFS transporter [unclassified Phyllobacterium]MCO4319099.1 MHS family MFS transporter [Phyllobacterium sp. 21LDTY02-6]MCX8279015.1 MFS transporter [Phyllobacterium sp. 0TCS1.6C]MCX8293799.1 MFS transporter [Phyllobacterium sp. 0TCS1.6A]